MSGAFAIPTLPQSLVLHPPPSDEEFEHLCAANAWVQLERTKEGTPTTAREEEPAVGFAPAAGWASALVDRIVAVLDGELRQPMNDFVRRKGRQRSSR